MAVIRNATFEAAVDQYCNANDEWMGDDETPLVTALFYIARQLDKASNSARGLPAGLTMEYRMQFVELHKHKPAQEGEEKGDALDQVLAELLKDE
ncbi:hypothetical protein [Rhodococcus sp. B10]|uniref:hypothetical protein n=1 Tax=Rhodococcus sp. B10 TaxID=2695876 RepID=UPI00143191E2|nr:hypothetical protein [Rhodococcus sp. B10]